MKKIIYGLALVMTFFTSSVIYAQMDPAPPNPDLKPVLEDFGGEQGLTELMEVFMDTMLENPQLRPFFINTDQERVKRQLVEQFCVILGGDCTYTGRSMEDSHTHLDIDRADFNALVEDLQIAMNQQGIPFRSQNKLLAVLAPMYQEIISK